MGVAADRIPELIRALHTALGDQTRQEIAEAIAAVGTREAYDQLAREVVRGGQIAHECMWVLRNHAPASTPYIIPVLLENPECAGLIGALPNEIDDDGLDALVSLCRRTTDPWVVGKAVDICARTRLEDIQQLTEVVEARRSELLHAGMITGLIAADPGKHLDRIKSLFAKDIEVQKLALSVSAALDLPEAQDCLRRMLREGKVADRSFALRVIEENRVSSMAPAVVDLYLRERSPRVKRVAWRAILANREAASESIMSTADTIGQELLDGAQGILSDLGDGQYVKGEIVDALLRKLHTAEDIWLLANVDGATCVETARGMSFVLQDTASTLAWLVNAGRIRSQDDLLSTIEKSLGCALGMCRQAWHAGVAGARHQVYSFSGLPVLSQVDSSASDPAQETLPVDAGALSGAMRRWAEAHIRLWLHGQSLVPPDGIQVDYPASAAAAVSAQAQILAATFRRRHGRDAEKAALTELGSSLDREQRARAVVLDFLAPDILEGLQEELNQEPLFSLSIEQRALADHFVVQRAHAGQWNAEAVGASGPVMCEQTLQVLLLRIIGTCVTARSTQLLLMCVGSANELVSELAETLLVEIGAPAIPRICNDVASVRRDAHRARLVEICRCIDAVRAAPLARQFIEREDPLLRAACVQALRTGGSIEDCVLLCELWGPDDELVQVSVLQALAALDADTHVDIFEEAVGSPCPGVWWAGIIGLMQCARCTREETVARLTAAGTHLQRYAAEMVAQPNLFAEWTCDVSAWPAPAAGNLNMGVRVVVAGPGPFEWGIPKLLAAVDGSGLPPAELLDRDEEFAREWMDYAWTDEYGDRLIPRLLELANGPDRIAGELACVMLFQLLAGSLMPCCLAFAEYHRIDPQKMRDRTWEAFRQMVVSLTSSDVHDLVAPNPSATNPMGDQGPPSMWQSSETIAGLIASRFAEALPKILGIPRPAGLDARDTLQIAEAIAREWRKQMEYQDFLYGFWVQPALSVDDLVWFACHKGADKQIKREMINYLIAATTVWPASSGKRQLHVDALQTIFDALLNKTARKLADRDSATTGRSYHEALADAEGVVEAEFGVALRDYDVFWAQRPATFLPVGTLARMSTDTRGGGRQFEGLQVPTCFLPFSHFLRKRFSQLLAARRRNQCREQANQRWIDGLSDVDDQTGSSAWRESEIGVGEDQYCEAGSATDAPAEQVHVLEVDGERGEYIDIGTLASRLGVEPDALRKRARRGQFEFIKVNGWNHVAVEKIPEIRWLFITNQQWARKLGVSRNTIARWKKEMPPDLAPEDRIQYLMGRATNTSQA